MAYEGESASGRKGCENPRGVCYLFNKKLIKWVECINDACLEIKKTNISSPAGSWAKCKNNYYFSKQKNE